MDAIFGTQGQLPRSDKGMQQIHASISTPSSPDHTPFTRIDRQQLDPDCKIGLPRLINF
jgi:hypothetical protein